MYMPNKKSNSKEYFANLLGSYFTSFFPLGNAKGNHSEDHKKCKVFKLLYSSPE